MHEGIIYAAGYCGSGMSLVKMVLVKKLLKLFLILNKKVLSTIFHWKIPFYNGYPWFVPVAINYFKMQDWWINSRE